LEGEKVVEGDPLTKIEKKVEEIRDKIQRVQVRLKPKARRIFSMYSQLSLSKALDRSSLRSMPGSWWFLKNG
jgi:hypothetical protein